MVNSFKTGSSVLRSSDSYQKLKLSMVKTRPGKSFTAARSRNFRKPLKSWIFRAFFVMFPFGSGVMAI